MDTVRYPNTKAPRSADIADFPSGLFWFQFMESTITNSTVLVDTFGNVTDMAVTEGGTGDADATYSAFTTLGTAGNLTYAQTATQPSLFTSGKSIIIELEMIPADSATDGAAYIEFGNPYNGTDRGFSIQHANTGGNAQIVVRNSANNNSVSSTLGSSPNNEGSRVHLCFVWDMSVSDPGSIGYYVNGVLQGSFSLSGTVGDNWIPQSGSMKIGLRQAGTRVTTIPYYNVRGWSLSAIPSNISDIVIDMAQNPTELPEGLNGVT